MFIASSPGHLVNPDLGNLFNYIDFGLNSDFTNYISDYRCCLSNGNYMETEFFVCSANRISYDN